MSPTSYQTAPPRISSLSCGERERQLLVNFSRCILVGAKRLIPLARPIILNRRHLDRLTHFKEAGTSPHADALFEEVLARRARSEEHTSELQSRENLVC